MKRTTAFLALFVCMIVPAHAAKTTAPGQSTTLQAKLKSVRYSLHVDHGAFSGDGATVLANAVAKSRFLLVGEDHLTRQIPQFTAALCQLAAPAGLAGMALETSPDAAAFVQNRLSDPTLWSQMVSLTRKYPDSIAILNDKQEIDMVQTCARLSGNPTFHVWGLDQTFIGSANWLIDKMLASHPGPLATAQLERLKRIARRDAAQARTSSKNSSLFLLNPSSKQELQAAAPAIAQDGGPEVQRLFHEIQVSQHLYTLFERTGNDNPQRSRLLKQNFTKAVQSLPTADRNQKIIVKFGDWHMYKGFNPLHWLPLGDYITEYADVHNRRALHICVLGAKGVHRFFGKYGQPSITKKFIMTEDPWHHWLAPAVADQLPGSWTLYDLRKLRNQKIAGITPGFQRLIYGYDLLVIIPKLTPAELSQ
jgi:hypothetical protein